jgi:hypothetical protein
VKIRFTETRTVKDGSGTTFIAGEVYDLPADSAGHWLNRHVAVRVDDAESEAAAVEGGETAVRKTSRKKKR